MLQAVPVDESFYDLPKISALMERSFPANERMPLPVLLKRPGSSFIALYTDDTFCGFLSLLTWRDITHILFFAVEEEFRGRGYGTRALSLVRELFPGQRLLADIESPGGKSRNEEERLARKRFYLRLGYRASGISYRWRGEDYEILVCGADISSKEFSDFWDQF